MKRILQAAKKVVFLVILTTVVMTTAMSIAPQKSEAAVLAPFMCGAAEELGWSNRALNTICAIAIMIEGNCCDYTGDPWYGD